MVDSIKGPQKTVIITTKPKPKAAPKTGFDEALKSKTESGQKASSRVGVSSPQDLAQGNLKILRQQQLLHAQHVQEIARQIQDGTYKMAAPEVLAEKIIKVITDKTVRERFIKKMLKEEAENASLLKTKGKMSSLELKKLVYMIKESQNGSFDDPELEAMIKEFM